MQFFVSKANVHATDEMVDQGKVTKEDKMGNDEADKGADNGSWEAQKVIMEMVGLFSSRNEKYRQMMERIQQFIVGMKKAENGVRQQIAMTEDPFQQTQEGGSMKK